MSNCSFCGNRPRLKCPLGSDLKPESFVTNVPLRGQVFGLHLPSTYPPFYRKKLNDKEIREGIDKYDLWLYVPPWQVPRIGTKPPSIGHHHTFVNRNMPMKKIICMAKKNRTMDGCIGRLKFDFPRFGKAKGRQRKRS